MHLPDAQSPWCHDYPMNTMVVVDSKMFPQRSFVTDLGKLVLFHLVHSNLGYNQCKLYNIIVYKYVHNWKIEWQNGAQDFTHIGTVVFPLALKHNTIMCASVCYSYIKHALEIRRSENRVDFHFFKLQMHYNYAFVAVTVNTSYSVLGLYSQLTHCRHWCGYI